DIRVEEVMISDLQPDSNRLHGTVRDDGSMVVPRTARCLRIPGPLLIDCGNGIREHTVIEVVAIPRHTECGDAARTAAHGCASLRIRGQLHVYVILDAR